MASRFLSGPAEGVALDTGRAPIFLRVVRERDTGKWDALDQPDDEPRDDEEVFAYRQVPGTSTGMVFACTRRATGGGRFEFADYRAVEPQPIEEVLRDNDEWRGWVEQMVEGDDDHGLGSGP